MSIIIKAVQSVYNFAGIDDPTDMPIKEIIEGLGIVVKEEEIDGSDGRIIMAGNSAVITLDSSIEYEARKKMILAHELGHFKLHNNQQQVFKDDNKTLTAWYHDKYGRQEREANEFAAEFLMPEHLIKKDCKGEAFDVDIIDMIVEGYGVSKTAAILRFAACGNHPVFVVYCHNNKVKWFKYGDGFGQFMDFEKKKDLPPPYESVAFEMFNTKNRYTGDSRKQDIYKSTWFEHNPDYPDPIFHEYCLYVPSYNYTLSLIWQT